jgi:hypothetical protein
VLFALVSLPTLEMLAEDLEKWNYFLLIILQFLYTGACIYILKGFVNVSITHEELILNYHFGRNQKLKINEIKGLIYKFHYDSQTKYSWKEIQIKAGNGKLIELRKWYFNDFAGLEAALKKRLTVLIPSTETVPSEEQLRDLQREINYFDLKSSKSDIVWGLGIGLTLVLLIILFIGDDVRYSRIILPSLIGLYFIYGSIKNMYYLRDLRASFKHPA